MLSICAWVGPNTGVWVNCQWPQLQVAKINSSPTDCQWFFSQRGACGSPSPTCAENSCAGNESCCEFVRVAALPCLEGTPQQHPHSFCSFILPTFLLSDLKLEVERLIKMSQLWLALHTHLFQVLSTIRTICINRCPPYREVK